MLPPELSPFGYNETIGADNMPLSKEDALKRGLKWQDDIQKTIGKGTIVPDNIPDSIRDVTDVITKEVLTCIGCERNYKITEQEFFFYKKMNIPIPRKCFFCRHKDRIVSRGPYDFFLSPFYKKTEDTKTRKMILYKGVLGKMQLEMQEERE
jgi:hypothetical protein